MDYSKQIEHMHKIYKNEYQQDTKTQKHFTT